MIKVALNIKKVCSIKYKKFSSFYYDCSKKVICINFCKIDIKNSRTLHYISNLKRKITAEFKLNDCIAASSSSIEANVVNLVDIGNWLIQFILDRLNLMFDPIMLERGN